VDESLPPLQTYRQGILPSHVLVRETKSFDDQRLPPAGSAHATLCRSSRSAIGPGSARLIANAREALDRARRALAHGAGVLVLGRDAAALAPELKRDGLNATGLRGLGGPELSPATFDAAVVVNALERMEWDRWALQQIHAVVRPGGRLVLVVPALASPATVLDLLYLASAAEKIARRWLRRLGLPVLVAPRFVARRYRVSRLHAMLDRLGFRVCAGASSRARSSVGWLGLEAVRESSLYGDPPLRPWPEKAPFVQAFEREHRPYVDARDQWMAAHPDGVPGTLTESLPAAGERVLVLAPHPDDELLGCGGTVAGIVAAGGKVSVLHATDGSEAASLLRAPEAKRRTVRLEEANAVARAMGFASIVTWRESNAAFRDTPALVEALRTTLREIRPQRIFVPFVTDIHPDHRALCRLLARALPGLVEISGSEVWSYQGWCLVPANRWCDVTDSFATVEASFRRYETAMKVEDYVHMALDRCYYNACRWLDRPRLAEVFHVVSASAYATFVTGAGDTSA
jgi:LmbE family N-acetylglucosaminyl deacetylase/SAM-dependent methyltransferase